MRVLFLAPRECWPPNTGAKLRNYYLAREVAQSAQVTFLAFADAPRITKDAVIPNLSSYPPVSSVGLSGYQPRASAQEPSLLSPERLYERVLTVQRASGYSFLNIVRGAVGSTPVTVLNYTTRKMACALVCILAEQDFDLVQVESIHLAAYLPILKAARGRPLLVCDWHNIESELMQRYSQQVQDPLRRLYARNTFRQLNILERRAAREFDAHITVSDRDRRTLLGFWPGARAAVIENGVDIKYFSEDAMERAHQIWLRQLDVSQEHVDGRDSLTVAPLRRRVLFVGSMDYHPNVDAVLTFAREGWPFLYEQRSDLVFTVVGKDPRREVRQLATRPGIEVTDTVEDVRPYYYEAVASMIPLRVGGGSRLKILEAMAAGVPVISTRLGAEGLDVSDGQNILYAESGEQMSRALIGLLNNARQWQRLANGGRALVSAQYDWSRLGNALMETYRDLLLNKWAS